MSESLTWFHKTSSLHEFLLRIWLEFLTVSMDHYQFLSPSTNAFSFGCCEWEISSTCACVWRLGSSWWGFLKEILDWGCSPPCFPPGQSWDFCSQSQEEVTSGSLDLMTSGPGHWIKSLARHLPWWVGSLSFLPSLASSCLINLTAVFSSSICC